MTQTLLLELGCEDLPARYVMPLANELAQLGMALVLQEVQGSGPVVYATPRRIAVVIGNLATQQPERTIDRQGPATAAAFKDGKPTPAALGFAKSCGVELSVLGEKDGKLHFSKKTPGKLTKELLPELFEKILKQMDIVVPKRMRWGGGDETFVRPVQWICCMLGSEVVPLQRFGVTASNITYGHRFHAPAAIALKSADDYESALKSAKVWADFESRKTEIRHQVEALGAKLGGHVLITDSLLDEVTTLVEWPVAIAGQFEQRYLELPPEVIVATVETNQRYFTVFQDTAHTRLTQHFITISNIESKDVAQVISGNERVVRPRLSDALFFWEQDLKQPLASYGEKLKIVTFQKDLGTTADKVARIAKLGSLIAQQLKHATADVERAATLCKNDLVTKMVYEFPELQGLMGGYYAEKSGENAAVSKAISEHYLPTQQGTPIPSTREGQIVSLADKLDTLAGIFAIGQKPTASKDPYALRRAALGALRICIEGKLPLDLAALLKSALEAQPAGKAGVNEKTQGAPALAPGASRDATTLGELTEFALERLRAYYEGLPAEMYEAVKSLGITAPLDFDARVQALRSFWALPAAKNLAAAHKRVRNILKQAGDAGSGTVQQDLLTHAAEKALAAKLAELQKSGAKADYAAKLTALATLREPVDAFFDGVMVNDKDEAVRANRLALLRELDAACREVADISCLPG